MRNAWRGSKFLDGVAEATAPITEPQTLHISNFTTQLSVLPCSLNTFFTEKVDGIPLGEHLNSLTIQYLDDIRSCATHAA